MQLHECVQYVEHVVRHLPSLTEEKKYRFLKMAGRIERRARSPYLHVALIGDFSAGKSTFINALVQRDILKTAWQATTAVPTFLYFHEKDEVQITVELADGQKYDLGDCGQFSRLEQRLAVKLPSEEKDRIACLSTSNAFEGQIRRIRICVPGAEEFRHICIIDTPGVNPGAEEAKSHAAKTQDILCRYADATIVLFQETQVYTNSFRQFLEKNGRYFMDDAIFIITMMDLADSEERDVLVEFVKDRLRQNFGIEHPMVSGCCAKAVVSGKSDEESRYWTVLFDRLREGLLRYMVDNRERILRKQTVSLLEDLVSEMEEETAQSLSMIERQKKTLEGNPVEGMEREMDENYKSFESDIRCLSRKIHAREEYDRMFYEILENGISKIGICTKLYGAGSDSLQGYMGNGFAADVKEGQKRLSDRMYRKFAPLLEVQKEYCKKSLELFHQYNLRLNQSCRLRPETVTEIRLDMERITADTMGDSMEGFLGDLLGGVANFFTSQAELDRCKEESAETIRTVLEQAREDNWGSFYTQTDAAGRQIIAAAIQMKKHLEAEYERVYRREYKEYLDAQEKLERKSAQIREALRYLNQMKEERSKPN